MAITPASPRIGVQEPTSRGAAIKSFNHTLRIYNMLLSQLRAKRSQITLQRERREIEFQQYWELRMALEYRIQDTIEKRDTVMRQMVVAIANK